MTKPSKITRHDPRHGTNRGYNAGCREDCCRHAHMIYKKLWYMGRTRRYIDATGTRRRLEGLAALGYSMADISARLGMTRTYVYQLRKSTSIRSDNAAKVGEVFEQLCMTLPDHPLAVRARRHAAKVGWLPPLAWDDIDDPDEIPDLAHDSQRDTLAEYRWLVAGGVSHEQAAKQLNITMNAIERAIDRERKAA